MKIKKSSLIIRVVIVALILYAGISLVNLKTQTQSAEERRDELQKQVDAAVEENEELQYAIEHSTDPEIIEDVARNDIGLVRPGEKLFYDVSD